MKVPFLPIYFDEFRSTNDTSCSSGNAEGCSPTTSPPLVATIFFLSHFHSDHMAGLTPSWGIGYDGRSTSRQIFCSRATRALLLHTFGEAMSRHVIALPMFEWVSLPLTPTYNVTCCLLPACHIPGSVMILLRTFLGTILYTGDVRARKELCVGISILAKYCPIDHVYLDDTWLHISPLDTFQRPPDGGEKRMRVDGDDCDEPHNRSSFHRRTGSKMLSDGELESTFQSFRRLLASLPLPSVGKNLPRAVDESDHSDSPLVSQGVLDGLRTASTVEARPYVLRVYLHNQFGKEILVQKLANVLGTRVVVSDARYMRLRSICSTYASSDEEVNDEQTTLLHRLASFLRSAAAATGNGGEDLDNDTQRWMKAMTTASLTGSEERINLDCFIPTSRAVAHTDVSVRHGEGGEDIVTVTVLTASEVIGSDVSAKGTSVGNIEIVERRAEIAVELLEKRTTETNGVQHFGLIMTGWAKLQKRESLHQRLWQVPYTLHSSPEQMEEFIASIRPLSLTPIHYGTARGQSIVAKLGRHLREPYVNRIVSGSTLRTSCEGVPLSLKGYIFGEHSDHAAQDDHTQQLCNQSVIIHDHLVVIAKDYEAAERARRRARGLKLRSVDAVQSSDRGDEEEGSSDDDDNESVPHRTRCEASSEHDKQKKRQQNTLFTGPTATGNHNASRKVRIELSSTLGTLEQHEQFATQQLVGASDCGGMPTFWSELLAKLASS